MIHKYGVVRRFTLEISDGQINSQEGHDSEEARNNFLGVQGSYDTDWYCVDVRENFDVDIYSALEA